MEAVGFIFRVLAFRCCCDPKAHAAARCLPLRGSNLDNKDLPLGDFLKQPDSDMESLPKATQKLAKTALYQGNVQRDADLRDVIQDAFLQLAGVKGMKPGQPS